MAYKIEIPTSTGTSTGAYYRLTVTSVVNPVGLTSPAVVTCSSAHGLQNGTKITFSDIPSSSSTELNGNTYYVNVHGSQNTQLVLYSDPETSTIVRLTNTWVINTIGYLFPGDNADFVVDRGLTRSSKQSTLTARFGDGYEQRLLDGINTKKDEFNISFKNRTKTEIDNLSAFFDDKIPKSFNFTIDTEVVKVVCENYNVNFSQPNVASLTSKFKRVYE